MAGDDRERVREGDPTVLDWVKSLLRLDPIPIPSPEETETLEERVARVPEPVSPPAFETGFFEGMLARPITIQLTLQKVRLPLAILCALFAQFGLDRKPERTGLFLGAYLVAAGLIAWATWAGDLSISAPEEVEKKGSTGHVRGRYLALGAVFSLLTFLSSRSNQFGFANLFFWIAALGCMMWAFWEGENPLPKLWQRLVTWIQSPMLRIRLEPWHFLLILSYLLIVFIRFSRLDSIPYEMWSDHAEKLLDLRDVLSGQYPIFFPRNTGREAVQFYLSAVVARLFGTGISFLTLKIGMALAGLLTLPYLYLFAREIGGRGVALVALLLAGIGYWPNVVSRVGLRYPLYATFAAPALYYFLRGIRRSSRNDLLLSGLATGIGLHGYSPARVVPLALAAGAGIYMLYSQSRGRRKRIFYWMVAAGVIALVVFIPLFSVATTMMDQFLFRSISRLGTVERAYPGSPIKILLENIWDAAKMYGWDDGTIWVVAVPRRPALDWVTGAFFHLGVAMVLVRVIKNRRWQEAFLLAVVPILMLPSIMSLAFPIENPAPNRVSAAIVPVFTIAAIPLAWIPAWAKEVWKSKRSTVLATAFVVGLFFISCMNNYKLVIDDFASQLRRSLWNTREMSQYIQGFAESIGGYDTAHVVNYPHWVDTRLLGIIAEVPSIELGIQPEQLQELSEETRPQLFIFKPEDEATLQTLEVLFPTGRLAYQRSEIPGKDFMVYFVPSPTELEEDRIELE
jgi:hypothetical protein